MKNKKRVFICADHGLAVVYFLQTTIISDMIEKEIEVVFLTDEALIPSIKKKYQQSGLFVESLKLDQAKKYSEQTSPSIQYWLHFLRRFGASKRINTEALDSQIPQVEFEAKGKRKLLARIMRLAIWAMRNFKFARNMVRKAQLKFVPNIYGDLFTQYKPDLVITSTPGWRYDRYLLREAVKHNIPTGSVIVGWDNPSSYSISGAPVDWVCCWSDIQKKELVLGSDWDPQQVFVGGIPSYDGYFNKKWLLGKEEYFKIHNLEPDRKLISYACSFITFAPNFANIKALVDIIETDSLIMPAQLLIRLHPNHFMENEFYAGEHKKIVTLLKNCKHVKLVQPKPMGGEFGHYSGEDMPEKSSMMAYSDIFATVYSTMLVEAAAHNTPIVSVCIDTPGGWNSTEKFSLDLSKIGQWPTHYRFRVSKAGQVATNINELIQSLNKALQKDLEETLRRNEFLQQEVTFIDGTSSKRVSEFLISCIGKHFIKEN